MITIRLKNLLSLENASRLLHACSVVLNGRFRRFLPRKIAVSPFSTGIQRGVQERGGRVGGEGESLEPSPGSSPNYSSGAIFKPRNMVFPALNMVSPLPGYGVELAGGEKSRGETPVSAIEPVMAEPYLYPPRARVGETEEERRFLPLRGAPRPYRRSWNSIIRRWNMVFRGLITILCQECVKR